MKSSYLESPKLTVFFDLSLNLIIAEYFLFLAFDFYKLIYIIFFDSILIINKKKYLINSVRHFIFIEIVIIVIFDHMTDISLYDIILINLII